MLKYLSLLRAKQWIKNLIIFFPLFFGGKLLNETLLFHSIIGFFLFSLTSSAGYIINDIVDVEKDKKHPKKKFRAIASGQVSTRVAFLISLFLIFISLCCSWYLDKMFFLAISAYFVNVLVYSFFLKRIPYVDILFIAVGFALRLYAGYTLSLVPLSLWLLSLTLIVAVMLGCGKRLEEIRCYSNSKDNIFRESLKFYNEKALVILLVFFALVSVILFGVYIYYNGGFDILLFAVSAILVFNYIYNAIKLNIGEPSDFFMKNWLNIIFLTVWVLLFFGRIYLR